MIQNCSPVVQALLGTLFTWGLTAAGSALVFVFSSGQRRILDGSLGFAAGVMLAASYWSLLAPAIELAEDSGNFGAFAFFPVAVGFTLGAAFVYLADLLLPLLGISEPPHAALSRSYDPRAVKEKYDPEPTYHQDYGNELSIRIGRTGLHSEGLAVGVGFGAVGKSASATFESARNLAIGIGIQNFPEGLAVSLPLRGAGFSTWRAFWYGQLSGMVEPLAGVFGAFAMVLAEPLLPYALGFAAGAMVYVVMDDIIPEAQTRLCRERGKRILGPGTRTGKAAAAGAQARTVSAEGAAFHLVALWEMKFWEALLGTPQFAEGELSTCKTRSRGVGGKKLRFWRLWWDLSASCPHHGNGLLTSCPQCSYCGSISPLCPVFSAFLSFLLALTYLGDSHTEMGLNQPPSRHTLLGL
ncbi:zinc transporter ZIP11 isoform X3 [Lepidochelys kempii]|uniref:zinc transporter ZIP11 isoform X3 n=1 Tax=Lepidochelys kempii TaxID=8472 RepID=UPI003C6EABCD